MYFFFFQGIQYLCSLQDLNLYYNNIPSLVEVSRLQPLPYLKELDLRLNPVVRKDTDYRLFAVYTLQTLEKLGEILPPLAFLQELDWSKLPLNLWKLSQSVHWQETFVYQSTFMEFCVGRMYDKYFYCLLNDHLWFYQSLPPLVLLGWWFLHYFLLNRTFLSWDLFFQVPSFINYSSKRSPVLVYKEQKLFLRMC